MKAVPISIPVLVLASCAAMQAADDAPPDALGLEDAGAVALLVAGQAVLDVDDFGSGETVVAGGACVRYVLAHQLGLDVGVDVGVGPEDAAIDFVLGSHWQGR